ELVHHPQLRLQRRHRNLHLHFRLHRGLRLWPLHAAARVPGRPPPGGAGTQQGVFLVGGARVLRRAWQIYVAHIFLFAIYIAEISYVASSFENPLYVEEMNAVNFLEQPQITIIQALLLKFKPVNMDVLPLYIVLLLLFPAILWLLK